MKFLKLAIVVGLMSSMANAQSWGNGEKIKGNGNQKTETRTKTGLRK